MAAVVMLGFFIRPTAVYAQQSSSTNYQVNEVFFGNGGELNACSTSYCSKQSAGETAVGNTSSTNYQAQAGFNTNREESLELVVNNSQCPNVGSLSQDVGVLSTASAKTATNFFSVKAYLASGYSVRTAGVGPRVQGSNPHTMNLLTSGGTSTPGTEQFGINLRANTSPSVGFDATQVPDNTFGFGQAAAGYNTVNNFRYNDGDVIATSSKSSGITCYTMSYLFNIANTTPAGQYSFAQTIVATGTY